MGVRAWLHHDLLLVVMTLEDGGTDKLGQFLGALRSNDATLRRAGFQTGKRNP
jgi:hypothetical protein